MCRCCGGTSWAHQQPQMPIAALESQQQLVGIHRQNRNSTLRAQRLTASPTIKKRTATTAASSWLSSRWAPKKAAARPVTPKACSAVRTLSRVLSSGLRYFSGSTLLSRNSSSVYSRLGTCRIQTLLLQCRDVPECGKSGGKVHFPSDARLPTSPRVQKLLVTCCAWPKPLSTPSLANWCAVLTICSSLSNLPCKCSLKIGALVAIINVTNQGSHQSLSKLLKARRNICSGTSSACPAGTACLTMRPEAACTRRSAAWQSPLAARMSWVWPQVWSHAALGQC